MKHKLLSSIIPHDGGCSWFQSDRDDVCSCERPKVIQGVKEWALSLIGENETPESYTPKMLTESELSLAAQAVQFQARNKLREQLRGLVKLSK